MSRRRRKSRNAPGMGGVFQRRDGRFVARITVDGKRRERYANDKDTAELYLDQLKADVGIPPDALITVEEYLNRWLRAVEQSVKPRAFESYELNVRRWIALIGKVRLFELNADQIEDGQRSMFAKSPIPKGRGRGKARTPGPLGARSVQQAHTVLHTALQYAVDPPRRWLLYNPCDGAIRPRVERHEMLTLNDEQLGEFIRGLADDPLEVLWVLFVTSGLRLGEALGLRWGDVDWKGNRVIVVQQMQWQRGKGNVAETPKKKRSRRPVAVPPTTMALLREHQKRQGAIKLQALVFCKPDGKPLDGPPVRKQLHTITKRLGLPDVRVHDLRHSYATALLSRGIHPKIVQELLGHSTIATTMDLYSHVLEGMGQGAANQLEELFSVQEGVNKVSKPEAP